MTLSDGYNESDGQFQEDDILGHSLFLVFLETSGWSTSMIQRCSLLMKNFLFIDKYCGVFPKELSPKNG